MDTIILAGGKGERLSGICAPYHKPLLVVNGQSLIAAAVTEAVTASSDRVVIVTAPANTQAIVEVLRDRSRWGAGAFYVVQPIPSGPADAVRLGLEVCRSPLIAIVCADNVIPSGTLKQCRKAAALGHTVVTVSRYRFAEEALRFSRVDEGCSTIYEGVKSAPWSDGHYRCWIGPVIASRQGMEHTLRHKSAETLLSPHIPLFDHPKCRKLKLVEANVIDIGTPAAVEEATS